MVMDQVSAPGGQIRTRATMTVPRGTPGLSIS
jgi:alkaline phosphatase D